MCCAFKVTLNTSYFNTPITLEKESLLAIASPPETYKAPETQPAPLSPCKIKLLKPHEGLDLNF
jgi:hypothetical protein